MKILWSQQGIKIEAFFLIICCLIGLVDGQSFSTNITYQLLRTTINAFSFQAIQINYNPSDSVLKTTQNNETFSLSLSTYPFTTSSSTTIQSLDSIDVNISMARNLSQEIYNFQSTQMTIVVSLVYEDVYYLNTSDNKIVVVRDNGMGSNTVNTTETLTKQNLTLLLTSSLAIQVKIQTQHLLQSHFIAILQKSKTTNYMLPFNLISLKKYNVFVNYQNQVNLQKVQYTNEPFLPTFWNELGQQVVVMPYLPYFSQCTGTKKRILLRDLLKPTQCTNKQKTSPLTYIQLLNPIQCQTKIQSFQCLIQQYNVANQNRQPWFYTNENDIFYLHPYALNEELLQEYLNSGSNVIAQLSTSMYNQRPVLYDKNIGINQKPVEFVFMFDVTMDRTMQLQIVSVKLQANAVRTKTTVRNNDNANQLASLTGSVIQETVSIVVMVNYFTDLENFFHLHYGLVFYAIVPFIITLVLYFFWKILQLILPSLQYLQTLKLTTLIIIPLIKGLILSLLTMFIFILFFYFISDSTHFSIIATTFDGDDSIESELLRKYNGRVGFALLICGLFVLIQGIKQTFKIPTQQEMKIILEDAEQQEQLGVSVIQNNQSEQNSDTMTKTSKSTNTKQSKPSHRPLQDIMFGIKTLQSRRSALTLAYFLILLVFQYNYKFLSLETHLYIETIIWLIIQPIIFTLIFQITTYYIFKDLIYTQAAMIVYQAHSLSTMVLKSDNIGEFIFYWMVCGVALCGFMPYYQIKLTEICQKLYKNQQPNLIQTLLLKKLPQFIKHHALLSYYERGLYYSAIFISQLCGICLLPFIFMLIELTFSESRIFSDIFVNSYSFKVIVLMITLLIPTLILTNLIFTQIFSKNFNFSLIKIIQLNHFTFRNRKVKWMSDIFRLNPNIADFLKQYENFHFSSQLYFILFSLAIAGVTITIGLKIIFQNQYICFMDPAMMFILAIIWSVGDILAMIISFLALKFKFYQKKQELKMRTKLQTIQKLLTLKSYTKYLNVKFVKDYFLYNYREWVMRNIDKILTKDMFLEDNGRLIKKMKFYKNLLKRKNLMKKRQSVMDGVKMSEKIIDENVGFNKRIVRESQRTLMSQGEIQRQNQDGSRMMTITVNGILKMSQRNNAQRSLPANHLLQKSPLNAITQADHPQVIKIAKQPFTLYAKPILYYWFYTAKQNILLKSLIQKVKQQKLQEVCQFCNMDLDLENIEKRDFQDLVNQFRTINVGKIFVEQQWVAFYRTQQEFITVCLQCKEKKLYLQKKRIKNVKYAKIIVLNWLIKCKSEMLHKKQKQKQQQYQKGLRRQQSLGKMEEQDK